MKMTKFKAGPLHKHLGRFTKQEFLDQGHNLSQFDINREFDNTPRPSRPSVDPGVVLAPPPRAPDTIDLGAPTTPKPVQDASRLERLASAGATHRIVKREARQGIRSARQAGDFAQVGALQRQRDAARNIVRQERARAQEALAEQAPRRRRRKKGLV